MKVYELMSKPATTCCEQDSLDTATGMMLDRDCGAIPVVDGEDVLVGMITDRDICMAAYSLGKGLTEVSASEIINGRVFAVGPNDTVQRAAGVMREHQVRRLPVVDHRNKVIGVLSLNDIVRRRKRAISDDHRIDDDELLDTIGAICTPNSGRSHS